MKAVVSATRPACCMLWVTSGDRPTFSLSWPINSSIFRGRHGVEGRAGLVHQQYVRLDGQRPGDTEALLLAPREAHPWAGQAVVHLVPEPRRLRRAEFTSSISSRAVPVNLSPEATLSKIDMVGNHVDGLPGRPSLTRLHAFHGGDISDAALAGQLQGLRAIFGLEHDRLFSLARARHLYRSCPKQSLTRGRWHRCIEASRHHAWRFCRRCSRENRQCCEQSDSKPHRYSPPTSAVADALYEIEACAVHAKGEARHGDPGSPADVN